MKKKKMGSITICSSASFYKQVLEVEAELKKLGFKVLIPLTANKMKRNKDFRVERYKIWYKDASAYKRKAFLT